MNRTTLTAAATLVVGALFPNLGGLQANSNISPILYLLLFNDAHGCFAKREMKTVSTDTALPLLITDNNLAGVDLNFPVTDFKGITNGLALNLTLAKPDSNNNPGTGHTYVGDLTMELSTTSRSHVIFAETGDTTGSNSGDSSDVVGPYTFTDNTTGNWWDTAAATGSTAPIPAGAYRTSAPLTGDQTSLNAALAGDNPNGNWTLNIIDNYDGDTGEVTAASLSFYTPPAIYWGNNQSSIGCNNQDGTRNEVLVVGIGGPVIPAVDPVSETLFFGVGTVFPQPEGGFIKRAKLNGSGATTIISAGLPSGVAVDSTHAKIYWTDFTNMKVSRANFDGSNPETLVTGIPKPSRITLDVSHNTMYFITYYGGEIYSADLNGSNLSTIFTASITPGTSESGSGIAVNPATQKLYYATGDPNVYVMDTNGQNNETLITRPPEYAVRGVALDGDKVYWAETYYSLSLDSYDTAIRSANLADGSNMKTVVPSTHGDTWGLAVLATP